MEKGNTEFHTRKAEKEDFPGGPVDKNLPANTGYTSSIPGPDRVYMPRGNYAHAPQLLNPHVTTTAVRAPRAWAPQQGKSQQWEAHALQPESGSYSSQLESKRPNSQK